MSTRAKPLPSCETRLGFAIGCSSVLSLLLLSAVPAPTEAQRSVTVETTEGLHFARFETPEGVAAVVLPADLRPGDTLSGTVWLNDRPSQPGRGGSSKGTLQGYLLELGGRRFDAASPQWAHTLEGTVRGSLAVRLLPPRGRPMGEAKVPLSQPQPAPEPGSAFEARHTVQAGRPLSIMGPFSGDLVRTQVRLGGVVAASLAQSPRQTWALSPADVIGPAELELTEAESIYRARVRSVGIRLEAGKLDLEAGEITQMTISVTGLEGLEAPLTLTVSNDTPSVVSLGATESETIEISPAEVPPGGTWVGIRTLRGRHRGSFGVSTRLKDSIDWFEIGQPQAQQPPKAPQGQSAEGCKCEKVDFTLKRDEAKASAVALNEQQQQLTVSVPFAVGITCTPGKGSCNATVTPEAKVVGKWMYFDETQVDEAKVVSKSEIVAPASFLLTGRCSADKSQRKEEKKPIPVQYTASVEAPSKASFLGSVKLKLKADPCPCQGNEATINVDTRQEGTGVQVLLSDLDGDGKIGLRDSDDAMPVSKPPEGKEPKRCNCTAASVDLVGKAGAKAKVGVEAQGSYAVLTLTLPYTSKIQCDKAGKGECKAIFEATGKLSMNAKDPTTGQDQEYPEFAQLGLEDRSVAPPMERWIPAKAVEQGGEIALHGACSGKEVPQDGVLIYRVFFLIGTANQKPVYVGGATGARGTVHLTLKRLGCGSESEEKLKVTFNFPTKITDPEKSKHSVTVESESGS